MSASRWLRGGEVGVVDEFDDGRSVGFGVFSQGPADGFLDEEFVGVEVFPDEVEEELFVRILFAAELKEEGGAAEPDIVRLAPTVDMFISYIRVTNEEKADLPGCQPIDRVPPGFGSYEVFE